METRIIKIHGCSGAGKTTVVRRLMREGVTKKVFDPNTNKVEGYSIDFPTVPEQIYVLGNYSNSCGGMDTVNSASKAMELVHAYSKCGHVIHEGLLQSTYYGAMGTDSHQYGNRYVYAFLDTPIDLCIERVIARREEQGSTNKFNPQLTRDKHRTILRLRERLLREGLHVVVDIRHDISTNSQIEEILNEVP